MSCFFFITTLHFESYLIPVVVRGGKNPSLSPLVLELQRPGSFSGVFGDSQSTPSDEISRRCGKTPTWLRLKLGVFQGSSQSRNTSEINVAHFGGTLLI